MRTTGYSILVIPFFCISIANASTVNYDKGEALAYARDYCSNYNPKYQECPGVDCANFVSQEQYRISPILSFITLSSIKKLLSFIFYSSLPT